MIINLYTLKKFRLRIIILIIAFSCVLTLILPLAGYCENWILINNYDDFTNYYDSSSIKIFKQDKIINVWVKDIYSQKGKLDKLDKLGDIIKKPLEYGVANLVFNYKDNSYYLKKLTYYSKSGDELISSDFPMEWDKLIPGSRMDFLLNKLLEDNNIKR